MFDDLAKQLSLKFVPARSWTQSFGDSGEVQNVNDGAYMLSSNGTRLPVTQNPDGTYTFTDHYNDPSGKSEKDQVRVSYQYDPKTGISTPTGSQTYYQPSQWIQSGRDVAITLGSVLAAGAGGAAMAGGSAGGAGAGAGAAAAAGGGAAGGGMTSAELAALYGTEGYGAAAGGGGLVTAGNAAGALAGTGAADSVAAGVGGQLGAAEAGGAAAGAGGGMSSADLAALYGSEGYGATGGAAAAGSGSGFWGSLASGDYGGAASAAGNWATSPSGLQTLGGLGSAYLQNNVAGNALDAQTNATNQANALQKYMYDTTRADYAPYRQAGTTAVGGLTNLLQNPNSITSDPGYQFGLNQGQTAVDRSAASKGGLYSGATLKALQRYGTDYSSTKLNDSFNRLASVAQLGATGTAGTAQAGSNYANQAGANTTGLGNAAAGNALYSGNIWGNALNGAVSAYNQKQP